MAVLDTRECALDGKVVVKLVAVVGVQFHLDIGTGIK
jgi:hypothetical protein